MTMAEPMKVKIITPDDLAYDGTATFISGQAIDGQFGIYPRHAQMVAVLDYKILNLDDEAGKRHHLAIFGGFIETGNNFVTIVTPECQLPADIDVDRAQRAMERAKKRLADINNPNIDVERAQLALRRALLRLSAVSC